jgi:orotate phosphoribosyltransferase
VLQDRLDVHNHRRGKKKTERQAQLIDLDTYYFKDKEICVFDDVVTTGKSYADFANKLEDSGAHVLGGMFLGKTYYRYNRQ